MVRITFELCEGKAIVHVAGQLRGADVPVLVEASRELHGTIELDLTDLRDVDEEGVIAIRSLCDERAHVVGASPYVRMRLQSPKSE